MSHNYYYQYDDENGYRFDQFVRDDELARHRPRTIPDFSTPSPPTLELKRKIREIFPDYESSVDRSSNGSGRRSGSYSRRSPSPVQRKLSLVPAPSVSSRKRPRQSPTQSPVFESAEEPRFKPWTEMEPYDMDNVAGGNQHGNANIIGNGGNGNWVNIGGNGGNNNGNMNNGNGTGNGNGNGDGSEGWNGDSGNANQNETQGKLVVILPMGDREGWPEPEHFDDLHIIERAIFILARSGFMSQFNIEQVNTHAFAIRQMAMRVARRIWRAGRRVLYIPSVDHGIRNWASIPVDHLIGDMGQFPTPLQCSLARTVLANVQLLPTENDQASLIYNTRDVYEIMYRVWRANFNTNN